MEHGKLVRDRIPEIIRSSGRTPRVEVLNGDDLVDALLSKLEEEVRELRTASPPDRVEELADIFEVVQTLAVKFGIDMAGLLGVAEAKRAERGGFDAGFWLSTT